MSIILQLKKKEIDSISTQCSCDSSEADPSANNKDGVRPRFKPACVLASVTAHLPVSSGPLGDVNLVYSRCGNVLVLTICIPPKNVIITERRAVETKHGNPKTFKE